MSKVAPNVKAFVFVTEFETRPPITNVH